MSKTGGSRRGAGRPPLPPSERMITVAFAAKLHDIELFDRAAEAAGQKRSEWLRTVTGRASRRAASKGKAPTKDE